MISVRVTLISTLLLCGSWPINALGAQAPPPIERPPVTTVPPTPLNSTAPTDSVSIRVVNTDLRAAVQAIGQYLDRPVVFTASAGAQPQVTLETPRPVKRGDVARLLKGLLESQNYELVDDSVSGIYRARPVPQQRPTTGAPSPNLPPTGAPLAAADATKRQQGIPELFAIPLKHARASDVAATINTLFGRGANGQETNGTRAGTAPGAGSTLADALRANQVPPLGTPPPEAVAGAAGRPAVLTGELTIVADTHGNSLLVRATRADFELIQAAVQQLDMRPLQVLVEVLIVEARRDRSLSLGIDATLGSSSLGASGATVSGTQTSNAGLGDFALQVMGIGGLSLNASLSAAQERGDVKIVSRPIVISANNETAEVTVGSQRPFVQVSQTLPTDGAARDQVVQYRDVGTKLSVKPTISIDGSVQLEVTQEVSSATTEVAFNAPVISTRSVRTQLIVHDSQTVVLGGLSDHERDATQGGVPILSSIPLIGGLFGHVTRETTDTELLIFITPHVLRSDSDAGGVSDSLRKLTIIKPPT